MGTDIHGVIAVTVPNPDMSPFITEMGEDGRNYRAFAAMAGVRNGVGFGGDPTHTAVTPLAEGRGIPADISAMMDGDEVKPTFSFESAVWIGDHSFTWFTIREALDYNWDQLITESGIIDREAFREWDGVSCPQEWCGGIVGGGVIVADHMGNNFPDGWTHVRIYWKRTLRTACRPYPAYFEYLAEKYNPDETRVIIGFDS